MGLDLPIILFVGGLAILLWLFLWSRQRQRLGNIPEAENANTLSDFPGAALGDGVLVASDQGRLTHVNAVVRQWLNLEGGLPTLETIARFAQPADSFLQLFAGEGQASFQLGDRWVHASAHTIPATGADRVVVVFRELNTTAASGDGYDLSKAILIVNEIGETVNASLGMEQSLQALLSIVRKSIPADAGEITLWDDGTRTLTPRGWVGDVSYVLALAEAGGVYRLEEGLTGWIARHKKPVLVTDKSDQAVVRPKLPETIFRSYVGVPLLLSERFIGTFELASIITRRFTQAELALLQAIAKPIAIAIYNAELYTEQARRIEDLARLQQIAGDDPRQAVATITEQIARLIGAEMCGILVYDARRDLLIPQAPFFGVPEFIRQGYAIPVAPGTEGRDIWDRESAWFSNDLSDDPLVEPLGMSNLVTAAGMSNTLIMALRAGGRRIGAIQLGNRRGYGGFALRDVQNLRLLASQAAVVIEDMRLKSMDIERDTEMESLSEITLALNNLSGSEHFLAESTEKVATLMDVSMCGILLYDETQHRLVAQLPFYGVDGHLVLGYGIDLIPGSPIEQVWDEVDSLIANDVESNALANSAGVVEFAQRMGIHHTLIAALDSGGRRIGAIQVSNKLSGERFNERDARLLTIFAAQLAGVLENSRLYREAQRRATEAERLRRVAELAGNIVTSDDSFAPVLNEIGQIVDSPAVFVTTFDPTSARLNTMPQMTIGLDLDETLVFDTASKDFERSVAISRRSFLSNDLTSDKRILPVYRQATNRLGLKQVILVPLVVGEQTLGEFGIANRRDPYTEEDVRLMNAMAIHVAAALDRVRLYENTGQNLSRRLLELDAIQRVSNELALTLDLDRVIDLIRVEAVRATEADGNTVAMLSPVADWRSPDEPKIDKRLGERRAFDGLAPIEHAAIVTPNQAILVEDYLGSSSLGGSERLKPIPVTARSAVAVAFTYEDQVVGIIHLYSTQPRHFDQRAAVFLTTLAAKASLSYGNLQRFVENQQRSDRLRRRVEQLNSIFELGQMIQTAVDPVMMLEAIAYSVQQSCGFDVVLMTLIDEKDGTLKRVAQAGIPIQAFEQSRAKTMSRENLDTLLGNPQFNISESFFFPFEQVGKWAVPEADVLVTTYTGMRTLYPAKSNDWRDGDVLVVPIAGAGGELLGVMSLDRPFDGQRPDRSTIEILEIFAHQAASTIENNRLYTRTVRDAEQEARLNEVMEAISSTLEMSAIIESVARGALRLLPFNRMTMALLDTDGGGFDMLYVTVTEDGALVTGRDRRPSLSGTALGRTFESGQDFLYTDQASVAPYRDLQSWWSEGEQTSLVVPLVTGGLSLGALHFGADQPRGDAFAEYGQLLKRIANLSAVAVQNARLFNQAVNLRLFNESVVQSIQQGIVVLDPSAVILAINDYMRRQYDWSDHAIRRDLFDYRPEYRPVLEGGIRQLVESGLPVELTEQRIELADQTRVQNFYLYPLLAGDQVRGVVLLIDDVTEREQLQQDLANRANQLVALMELSSRINLALRREDVIGVALDEMNRVIGYDTLCLWRRQGDLLTLEASRGFEGISAPMVLPIHANERLSSVINTQHPVSISRLLGTDPLPGEDGAQSWLGIPLLQGSTTTGVIALSSRQQDTFTAESEQAALTFANQVAIALTNAGLFEQQRATTERLNLLNRASMRLAQSLDTENILEVALSELATLLSATRTRAYLFERDTHIGRVVAEFPRGDFPPTLVIELDTVPAISQIIHTNEMIVIENVQTLPPDHVLYEDLANSRMSGYTLIPMTVSGQVTGAFELELHHDTPIPFDPEKLDLALIISSQAAIAVMNANLLEQTMVRTRELETLLEAAQATSLTLDLNEVFARVVELTMFALDMDDCTLMMYDNVENTLHVEHNADRNGSEQGLIPAGTEYSLLAYPARVRAIRDRQVIVVRYDDPEGDAVEREDMASRGDLARMLIPLTTTSTGEAIGLVQADLRGHMRQFTHREIRMASALGAQAATRIENARLTTETAAQVEQGMVINELSRAISSTMDIDGMIQTVRQQVAALMNAEDIYMALYTPETQEITFPLAVHNGQDVIVPSRKLSDDEVSFVIKTRRPLSLGGEMGVDEVRRNLKIRSGEGSVSRYLGVPIIAGDQVQGVLALRDTVVTRPFGLNDQRVLTTIGAQIGAAIQNARLFERIRRFADDLNIAVQQRTAELQTERDRLDSLYRITSELGSTLDMDMVLNRALTMTADAIGADDGVVLLLDPMSDRLYSRATLHVIDDNGVVNGGSASTSDLRRTREITIAGTGRGEQARVSHPAEMLANWLINTHDDALVGDLRETPYWSLKSPGAADWRSALAVVLKTNDAVQGVIVFLSRVPDHFSEPQLKLVSAASSQVSSAINNADLYNLLRDQTERMASLLRAEREEAEKNSAILEGIADGVLLANADGIIVLFNRAAETILEIPRDYAQGQPLVRLETLYSGAEHSWVSVLSGWINRSRRPTLDNLLVERIEVGRKVINITASPVFNGDVFLGTVAVFRDITRDVEVDRMKSEFISNVSHELRTPMTSIKGYADLLIMGAAGQISDQQRGFLETIKNNAERLSNLVNDLLNISRLDSGSEKLRIERFPIRNVITQVVETVRARSDNERKHIDVTTAIEPDLPPIAADESKVSQILANLVDNAFNYTYPGGKIEIEVRRHDDPTYLLIVIRDNGIGIPKEFQPRIWNRFERFEEHALVMEVAGTGLGLSIVKNLVDMHKGQVWLESEPNVGSTFYVALPIEGPDSVTPSEDNAQVFRTGD